MTLTPDRTTQPEPANPDIQRAWDYIDNIPTELRGRELALQVVYIVENFPKYHDQKLSCSANSACLVGWTDVLASKPLMDKLDIQMVIERDTRFTQNGEPKYTSGLSGLYHQGWTSAGSNPVAYAAKMLGIPDKYEELDEFVYGVPDRKIAISNFKILTGLAEGELYRS